MAVIIRQSGLAREIAAAIARFIAERQAHRPFDTTALAERARRIEEKADRIAIEARSEIARFDADRSIERLVNQVEDAIDELEQAAFVASLVPTRLRRVCSSRWPNFAPRRFPAPRPPPPASPPRPECPTATASTPKMRLAAVGRLIDTEHRADAAERMATARILTGEFDLKTTLSVLELARALERSTDRMAAFGHLLREHVLADLSA